MVVTLYTSRVVLQQLGIDDYGIYSVIGGVITLFTFFNQSMCTSTQRYITYELGKPDGNVSRVFSICLKIHVWIAVIVVILAETIGLWFVNHKMVFPAGSMYVVNWTYQISIVTCVITILRFPYNALVLAYEKMSFYAYNSIIEVVFKLLIVYLLVIVSGSKLVAYMLMLSAVTLGISLWYMIYCHRQFPQVKYVSYHAPSYYKEILSFSGWAMFGSVANVGFQQGVSIIVNLFYGVAMNAAIGIANQVYTAIIQFVSGFQQALNPQLIKSEASGDKNRQTLLISTSAKFSFMIMLLIAYPLVCNINYVLTLWLGNYPPETGVIASLIIGGALLETLSGPLWVTIFATGKIKGYQVIISMVLLLNVPIAYFLGMSGLPVWNIYIIRILIFLVALFIRLIYLNRLISFNLKEFSISVLLPLSIIMILLAAITAIVRIYVDYADSFFSFLWQTLLAAVFVISLESSIGLTKSEYNKIKSLILSKIKS